MTGPHPPLGPQPGDPDYSRYAPGTNERLVLRELEQNAGRLSHKYGGLLEVVGHSNPHVAGIYHDVLGEVSATPHPKQTDARDKHIAKASHAHVARLGDLDTIRQKFGSYENARRMVLRAHHALAKHGMAGNSPEARAKQIGLQSDLAAYTDLMQQIEAMRSSVKSPNIVVFGFLAIRNANQAKNRAVRAEVMTNILGMGYGGLVGEVATEQRGYNGLTQIKESSLRWLSTRLQEAFSPESDQRAREEWINDHAERLARQDFKDPDDPVNATALANATRRYAARITHMVDDGIFGGRVKGRAKLIASYARGVAEDQVAPVTDPDDEAAVAARAKEVSAAIARYKAEFTSMAKEDVLDIDGRYRNWLAKHSATLAANQLGYAGPGESAYESLVQRYRVLIEKMCRKGILLTEGSAAQFGHAIVDYEYLTQDTLKRREEYKALQRTARTLILLARAYYGATATPGTAVAYANARLRSRNRILNPGKAERKRQDMRAISAVAMSGVLAAVAVL